MGYQGKVIVFFAATSCVAYVVMSWLAPLAQLPWIVVPAVPIIIFVTSIVYGLRPLFLLPEIPSPEVELWAGHMGLFELDQRFKWTQDILKEKKYNPITKIIVGRRASVIVNDPDLVREVFVEKFRSFHSRPNNGFSRRKHLFVQEGDEWKKSRKTLAPSFNTENLTKFTTDLNSAGDEFVERLDKLTEGEIFDCWRWYGALTLQAICATSFGRKVQQEDASKDPVVHAMQTILGTVSARQPAITKYIIMFPLLFTILNKLPIPGQIKKIREAMKCINIYTDHMKDEMRAGEVSLKQAKCFLNLMLNAKDKETGKQLEDDEIRDQSFLFMLAGYETTANTLAFTSYSLATNPRAQQKVLDEIDSITKDIDGEIQYNDLKKFVYLDWVIQETLRLYPPVTELQRRTYGDVELGGYKIPAGTTVGIPTYSLQRDPKIYGDDAEEYRPERWDPNSEEFQKRHKFAWFPFGEGPRKCLGYRFALEELKIVLVRIYSKYTFKFPEGEKMTLRSVATLSPQERIPLIAIKRT